MHNFRYAKYWAGAVGTISFVLLMISRNSDFWTVLAGIGTFASLAFVMYVHFIEHIRRQKRVTVSLISLSTLINTAALVDGMPLKVVVGEEPVNNFAISRIEIVNSGGAEIVADDFERNLSVAYDNVDKIYYAKARGHSSPSLSPVLTIQGMHVLIEPLLLNPGDRFVIEAGIDLAHQGADLRISAFGRIAGVSEIEVRTADGGKSRDAPDPFFAREPDSGHLFGAAGLGFIGGIALAGVLAVVIFNRFSVEEGPNVRSDAADKIMQKPVN